MLRAIVLTFVFCFPPLISALRTREVCFPIGHELSPPEVPDISQGRPGKIGPTGSPGPKGEKGNKGASGQCACVPSEIERVREDIQRQNDIIENILSGMNRVNRLGFCGVGLKDGRVRDEDITASSVYDTRYEIRYGRLDNRRGNGAWLACSSCKTPGANWIQVDLHAPTRVVAVVTQGATTDDEWVTQYKISYGDSTDSMRFIQSRNGGDMIFTGNRNRNSHVFNDFPSPIIARYFRLVVQAWNSWGAVRVEYLTC